MHYPCLALGIFCEDYTYLFVSVYNISANKLYNPQFIEECLNIYTFLRYIVEDYIFRFGDKS